MGTRWVKLKKLGDNVKTFNLEHLKSVSKTKRYIYGALGMKRKQLDDITLEIIKKYPAPYNLSNKLKIRPRELVKQFLLHDRFKYTDLLISVYEKRGRKEISLFECVGLLILIRHCEGVLGMIKLTMEESFSNFEYVFGIEPVEQTNIMYR